MWTYRQRGQVKEGRVEVFGTASGALRGRLDEEVVRLAALLGRDLELSIGPADIAAHL